ncbi:MAG: hypothetical protein RR968_00100 [Vagococcus sp.]
MRRKLNGTMNGGVSDEENTFFINYYQQVDNPIFSDVIVPASYVNDFMQSCFENNPLLKEKFLFGLEDRVVNGTGESEPVDLLNERNE